MKPSFIAIVLYPFLFVSFSRLPIWKGRYMQLFQRINVVFFVFLFVGIGYGVGEEESLIYSMICYMSWLTVSIFICYLFIYYYYYCKLSHIRVCGFLVSVSVCSFESMCMWVCVASLLCRLDHLVNIQSNIFLVKLMSKTELYGLVLINLIVLVFEMKLGAEVYGMVAFTVV